MQAKKINERKYFDFDFSLIYFLHTTVFKGLQRSLQKKNGSTLIAIYLQGMIIEIDLYTYVENVHCIT